MDIQVLGSGSKGNCYRISDGRTPLLLECGLGFQDIRRRLNFQTSTLEGCLITHEHGDHAKAVKDIMKAGIDCYLSKGTKEALAVEGHRLKIVEARKQFSIGTWTILPFETEHDCAEPLGFLLGSGNEKLLYVTDSYYCKYNFHGMTHIMIECNYCPDILSAHVEEGRVPENFKNRLLKSHFSLPNVKDFLRANDLSRVQEIWLIHLSDFNSDADRFKREISELTGKVVYIA
jgi:phosphoribosyl 1,2-cyclic phosphodiesterase